ncbi:MAG: mechanosensitive ion channel family protein, partial [Myxococcota bacterium]
GRHINHTGRSEFDPEQDLERPFEVGDYVRVADAEGQVHAFRTRMLEMVAPDGHRLFVPYRALSGTTDVRPGGRRRAYAVCVSLPIPDGVDPSEALALADEVARASPWSTLASEPKIKLASETSNMLEVEAFAFHADAQPLLHAELLKSWAAASRRWV